MKIAPTSYSYSSREKSSIVSTIDKSRDFKTLERFYFSAVMVKDERREDFKYMQWLFNGIKSSLNLKSLFFTFVYYFTIRQDSPLVFSLPFKNFLRLGKLQRLTVSVNILLLKQRAHLWRAIGNMHFLKSLTIDLFNRPTGMLSPYLYDDTANNLSIPLIKFHFYFSTMDLFIFAKFIKNIDIQELYPKFSKETKIEKNQLMYSLATFDKQVKNKQVVNYMVQQFRSHLNVWGLNGEELGFIKQNE